MVWQEIENWCKISANKAIPILFYFGITNGMDKDSS